MDLAKYNALAELVKEAYAKDKEMHDRLEQARLDWKKANEVLTERQKTFDGYINQCKNEDTGRSS